MRVFASSRVSSDRVLQADQEQGHDADEEHEVGRDLDPDESGSPLERDGEHADDEREQSGDEPPDGMALTQPSAPQ